MDGLNAKPDELMYQEEKLEMKSQRGSAECMCPLYLPPMADRWEAPSRAQYEEAF